MIVDHPGHLLRSLGPWDLVEGAQIDDMDIVLDDGLAITGVLRLPDGTPVDGVQVLATSLSESSDSRPRRLSTKSRRDGTFRLSGLEDHDYAVFAQEVLPLDPRSESKAGRLRWTAAVDRLTAGAQGLVLILDHGSTVQGRVVDDLGGSIARVNVTLRSRESHGVQSLSQQLVGSDRPRIDAVPRGSWWLDATTSPGTATTSIAIELPADSGRELELVLARPATIEGRVLDSRGIPVGGAHIHCRRFDVDESGGRPEVSDVADEKGRYRFSKITATKQRLVASTRDGHQYAEVVLQLAPGETRSGLDVRLK